MNCSPNPNERDALTPLLPTPAGTRPREPLLTAAATAAGVNDVEIVDAEPAFQVIDDPTEVAALLAMYKRNHVGYFHGIPVHHAEPPENIPDAEVVE